MKRAVFDPTQDMGKGNQPAIAYGDKSRCHADNCPCRGTASLGGGPFLCAYHAWADGREWGRITAALHEHAWFLEFIAEATRLHLYPDRKGRYWEARAREFWTEQPDMQPTPRECGKWPEYLTRLRQELAYRVGARKDRPVPLAPEPAKQAQAKRAVVREVEEAMQ